MIVVVGIGPGDPQEMTIKALKYLKGAKAIFGVSRQIELVESIDANLKCSCIDYGGKLERLYTYLDLQDSLKDSKVGHNDYAVVLASGDPLLYGIGSTLRKRYGEIVVISGISSLHTMFTRIDLDMNDVFFTSAHGRDPDFSLWLAMDKVACVTDKRWDPKAIATYYFNYGAQMSHRFYVGENLGYSNERIITGNCSDIMAQSFESLCVVVIKREGS